MTFGFPSVFRLPASRICLDVYGRWLVAKQTARRYDLAAINAAVACSTGLRSLMDRSGG
jgi:hypothetical protein